jgi:hypothetical protein
MNLLGWMWKHPATQESAQTSQQPSGHGALVCVIHGSECQGLGSLDVILDRETTWFRFSSFCDTALDCQRIYD